MQTKGHVLLTLSSDNVNRSSFQNVVFSYTRDLHGVSSILLCEESFILEFSVTKSYGITKIIHNTEKYA
jgi:UDP-glucose 4-epimerase